MKDNIKKVILKVEDMVCVNCENLIEDVLLEKDGVIKVEASHNKGTVKIDYNEDKIPINYLIKIINEEGYKAFDLNNKIINKNVNSKNKKV